MTTPSTNPQARDLNRWRLCMGVVIAGLVVSGLTAFPLLLEMQWLAGVLGAPDAGGSGLYHSLQVWITRVRDGLADMHGTYPWIAYGTDWLAFGHLVIALFFVGPLLHPTRDHRSTLLAGITACVGVIPLAFIAGHVRGIPWGWRLIDCTFGVIGIVPLLIAWRLQTRLRSQDPS